MVGRRRIWNALLFGVAAGLGCSSTPVEPFNPAWADVAPIFRGECNSCHGWTAGQTGGGYRFDFFDATKTINGEPDGPILCGDAALALSNVTLAGTPGPNGTPIAAPYIAEDVVKQAGAAWPRMPPQPSPALPDWERDALQNWAWQPVKGPAPVGNRPPTLVVYDLPAQAAASLSFTAVIDDPDGDSAIGVVEAGGFAFLMNRPGSFDVNFDTSRWPAGSVTVKAVLCDGWTSTTIPIGAVQIVR